MFGTEVDQFKFAWPRPSFCDPKIWEAIIAKHKNDRHVPGNVKSPLSVLALSKVAEKRIESTSCIWKSDSDLRFRHVSVASPSHIIWIRCGEGLARSLTASIMER